MPIVAAAIQFNPIPNVPQRNLDVLVQLAFQAGLNGANLVVFPELSTSGYVLKNVREASSHAQTMDGYQTRALQEVARSLGIYVAFGYVELAENALYNSAAIVGPMGLLCNVRKSNLRGSDFLWATPGEPEGFVTAMTSFGRLGALVGRDASNKLRESHPAHALAGSHNFYVKGSVDTIAVLAESASDLTGPNAEWIDLVESLGCNVVVAAREGTEGDVKFNGGSCVVDRNFKIWCEGTEAFDARVIGGQLL